MPNQQRQRRVRFYDQVDIMPIDHPQRTGRSAPVGRGTTGQDEDHQAMDWRTEGNQSADQLPRPSNLFSAADVLDVDGPPPARTASIVGDKEKLKADLVPQPSNPNEAGDIMDTAGLINVPLRPPPGKPSSGLVHRQYNQIAASSIVDIEGLMNMPLRLPPARPAAKAGEERRLSVTKVPRPYIQIEESEVIDGEELINVPLRAPPVHPAGMPGAPTMDAASIDSGSDEMQRWEVDDDRGRQSRQSHILN
ncbi:hypothetical protein EV401DRAFT_415112 [Pisolithus croceorrhizus]|nr:hypothetical protein EV401DRAFT_415112 [Pisolithus croceorrhizus]